MPKVENTENWKDRKIFGLFNFLSFQFSVKKIGASVRDNNIFGRESPALFKILYEESTLADIWSLRPEIPPSLSHQCSSAPHSATSLAAEHFLMSADILRDFSRIKDGWDKRYFLPRYRARALSNDVNSVSSQVHLA